MVSQDSYKDVGALAESNIRQIAPMILIVDDDAAMRLIMRQALERDGYRLLEASKSGKQPKAARVRVKGKAKTGDSQPY